MLTHPDSHTHTHTHTLTHTYTHTQTHWHTHTHTHTQHSAISNNVYSSLNDVGKVMYLLIVRVNFLVKAHYATSNP